MQPVREELVRALPLFGQEGLARLARARVAVFGLGGVGGYAVEVLARSGVGAIDLIDHDVITRSNLNRQILATQYNIGQQKTQAAAERIRAISPACVVREHPVFYLGEAGVLPDFTEFDYVIDAIDTVTGKLAIVQAATAAGVPVISAMGTGNKLDISALKVADISATSVCPLARVMRRELKKRGIGHLQVVYSTEQPRSGAGRTPASCAFVPAAAGLMLAGEAVKYLSGTAEEER